jgi:hypothetical protein
MRVPLERDGFSVLATSNGLSGLAAHEWLGLAVGTGLAVHLIWHWKWVVGATRKFLAKLPLKTRVYYALDAALLLSFLTIVGSGVAMSGAVLSALGLSGSAGLGWVAIHKLASMLALVLLAVKLALHGTWIGRVVRRLFSGKRPSAPAERRGLASERVTVLGRDVQ